DPPANADKDAKKRKRKDFDTSSSKKGKDQAKSSKKAKTPSVSSATEKDVDDEELIRDDAVDDAEMNWFNELVKAEKDTKEFDDLMGSTIDFTKFAKNCLKKDKITKVDLEGPAFALLNRN
ncbi:hypothetical protein Tco_1040502, partial [Tanacetum coccineum]